jgi:hypothetical protein
MGQSWSKARRYDPGLADVAQFDREELIAALRIDQAGKGFHDFLLEIVRYLSISRREHVPTTAVKTSTRSNPIRQPA